MLRKNMIMAICLIGCSISVGFAQTTPPPTPAPAAPTAPVAAPVKPSPAIIGTADVQSIIRQSNVGKSLVMQADQKQKALQNEILKNQQSLRTQQQQLLSQRASLKAEDFNAKEKEIQNASKKYQEDAEKKRKAFEASYGKAIKQIYDALAKILPEIAQQRGMNIILNKPDVVVSDDNWDISAEALKRLNATISSVKMQ